MSLPNLVFPKKVLKVGPVAHLGARRDVGGSPNIAVEAIMTVTRN